MLFFKKKNKDFNVGQEFDHVHDRIDAAQSVIEDLEQDTSVSFKNVKHDMNTVAGATLDASRMLKRVVNQQRNRTRRNADGELEPTLRGRIEAIEAFLGIEYKVEEPQRIPAKVTAVKKAKKGTK